MLKVTINNHRIQIGDRFVVSLQRTLRIPNDGRIYPLPPGLGVFPVFKTTDYSNYISSSWIHENNFFIPMYQREALWLGFTAATWKPNAIKVAVGRVNAISGGSDSEFLCSDPQNYMVCPGQPWLDGINSGRRSIRQFVAMPLGLGYTVEGNITGGEKYGAIQIKVFEPKAGLFPDQPPKIKEKGPIRSAGLGNASTMGLAAGGKMKQKIYPDPYRVDAWDTDNFTEVIVHIVNSRDFQQISGQECPPTPVDAAVYTKSGLPWFDLYDESEGDIAPPKDLTQVESIQDTNAPEELGIKDSQIQKLTRKDE